MPSDTGQHQVKQHQVRPGVTESLKRLVSVGDERRLKPLAAEHDAKHLRERRVVVDDQHASFHEPHRSMCLAPSRAPAATIPVRSVDNPRRMRRLPLFTRSAPPASPFARRAAVPPVTETFPDPTSRPASRPAPGPVSTPNASRQQPLQLLAAFLLQASRREYPAAALTGATAAGSPTESPRAPHLRDDELAGTKRTSGRSIIAASDYRVNFSPFSGVKLHTIISGNLR